jgi:hypothetical protein
MRGPRCARGKSAFLVKAPPCLMPTRRRGAPTCPPDISPIVRGFSARSQLRGGDWAPCIAWHGLVFCVLVVVFVPVERARARARVSGSACGAHRDAHMQGSSPALRSVASIALRARARARRTITITATITGHDASSKDRRQRCVTPRKRTLGR